MRPYLVAVGLLGATLLTPAASYAANAGNPYGNVNHANDAGNDTGDAQVDQLNQQQLNSNGIPQQAYTPGYVAPPAGGPLHACLQAASRDPHDGGARAVGIAVGLRCP